MEGEEDYLLARPELRTRILRPEWRPALNDTA